MANTGCFYLTCDDCLECIRIFDDVEYNVYANAIGTDYHTRPMSGDGFEITSALSFILEHTGCKLISRFNRPCNYLDVTESFLEYDSSSSAEGLSKFNSKGYYDYLDILQRKRNQFHEERVKREVERHRVMNECAFCTEQAEIEKYFCCPSHIIRPCTYLVCNEHKEEKLYYNEVYLDDDSPAILKHKPVGIKR